MIKTYDYEDRVKQAAKLFLEDGATVRSVADELGVSKSTVGLDLKYRVPKVCNNVTKKGVAKKLSENKDDATTRAARASAEKRGKKRD